MSPNLGYCHIYIRLRSDTTFPILANPFGTNRKLRLLNCKRLKWLHNGKLNDDPSLGKQKLVYFNTVLKMNFYESKIPN